ncbi:MAG: hypothetical protein ACPHF4_13100 [Rubripirellula sp.]
MPNQEEEVAFCRVVTVTREKRASFGFLPVAIAEAFRLPEDFCRVLADAGEDVLLKAGKSSPIEQSDRENLRIQQKCGGAGRPRGQRRAIDF